MERKTLETVTTTTEQGAFSAIAATYSVDRVNDQIKPGAFEKTIARWQGLGKKMPLHWDHQGSADAIIGYVDPATMRETSEGLYVEGKLDLKDSRVAREAWRSMKNDAVALSFGYLATDQKKGKDGINSLLEIDVFEISVVPAPANPDTRFLSLKGVAAALEETKENLDGEGSSGVEDGKDEEPERAKSAPQDPLRKRTFEVALEVSSDGLSRLPYKEPAPEPSPQPLDERQLRRRTDELRIEIASG